MRRFIGPVLAALLLFIHAGCGDDDGGGGVGRVQGRLAAFDTTGGLAHVLAKHGHRRISLNEISVDLMAVTDPAQPDTWTALQTVQPNPDGTFSFQAVPPGMYAVQVNQPEFSATSYYVDSTEFQLGGGDDINLVLPLVSHIFLPETFTLQVATTGFGVEGRPIYVDPQTGMLYASSTNAFIALNTETGKIDMIKSASLFGASQANAAGTYTAYLPNHNAVLLGLGDRLVHIDLGLFTDPDASEVFDYDDLDQRAMLDTYVTWRPLPKNRWIAVRGPGQVYVSADESTVYFSASADLALPGPEATASIIDVASLTNVRNIGPVIGYHPTTDRLLQWTHSGCTLVEASTVTDVGACYCGQGLPVPGTDQLWIVSPVQNNDGVEVPWIKVVDADCNVLEESDAKDYFGVAFDVPYGLAAFDATGDIFYVAGNTFRKLSGGGWEYVPMPVPPGTAFTTRTECHTERLVDTTNNYRLDWGCSGAPLALYSLDQRNIPVAIRVEDGYLGLDPSHGRALLLSYLGVTVVHYADPDAYQRTDIDLRSVDPRPERDTCSETEPCPTPTDLCLSESPTALSGQCYPNYREPFWRYCGGLTDVACDAGYLCNLLDDNTPGSLGECALQGSTPCADLAVCGPDCSDGSPCGVGTTCVSGRCVDGECVRDSDCPSGQVCGTAPGLARTCLTPGALGLGDLCYTSADCATGTCVTIRELEIPGAQEQETDLPRGLRICQEPCWGNGDCDATAVCTNLATAGGDGDDTFGGFIETDYHCVPEDDALCQADCPASAFCGGTEAEVADCHYAVGPGLDSIECEDATDCPDVFTCVRPDRASSGMCSATCQRTQDCIVDHTCYLGGLCDERPCGMSHCQANEICTEDQVCLAVDACTDNTDCPSGRCFKGVCASATCATNSDCSGDEECTQFNYGGTQSWCVPKISGITCGCTGADAPDAVCVSNGPVCILKTACTVHPCNGATIPQCDATDPNNLADDGNCDCPACSWDNADCGTTLYNCPGGWACAVSEAYCECIDSSCQTTP